MEKLARNFYLRDALTISKEILGKYLVHNSPSGKTVGKIVETEAYLGEDDPASHAYGRGMTERTKIQYGEGGYAYVYQTYGVHFCFNVVCGKHSEPHCVHIRALEPVEGIEVMKKRRKIYSYKDYRNLTNGPAKLCQAMGITKDLYGEDLCGKKLYLLQGEKVDASLIISAPRIGIDYAGKAKDYPWRFFVRGNRFVSVKI
jgi:DNA-3-methyladenine glycosylase